MSNLLLFVATCNEFVSLIAPPPLAIAKQPPVPPINRKPISMQTTIAPSFNLHLAARSHLSYSDRLATAHLSYDGDISLSNLVQCQRVLKFSQQSGERSTTPSSIVIKPRQYKQIVNLSRWGFTIFVEIWFPKKGILVNRILAPLAAHRGYEGSGNRVQSTQKDLETIAAYANAKAVERQDYQKQINCLVCAYIKANAIVQQLFIYRDAIVWSMDWRELSVQPVNARDNHNPMASFAIAISRGERSPPVG
jgi:hypothetical protein